MKTLPLLATVLLLSTGAAFAQSAGNGVSSASPSVGSSGVGHDVTGFSTKRGPGISQEQANRAPNPHVVLHPKAGGVFTDGVKYGTVMISPTAPAEYGMGEKYLSAPNSRYDLDHESGPAAHHDAGGMKLFTLEF